MSAPLPYVWRGGALHPLNPHFARKAADQFGDGQVVTLEVLEDAESSDRTRAHQFAWLREAWLTLPEEMSVRFPSELHLRKWALIEAGFHDERVVDAGSKAAAERVAAFAGQFDAHARVVNRGPWVVVRTARSQSRRSMDKAEFQASKEGVLRVVADLLDVPVESLEQKGGVGNGSAREAA